MNIFDKINRWLDSVEYSFVTTLSKIIPLAVPLIPAYVGYRNVVGILGFSEFFGVSYGAVIEAFGYAAIFKAVQFWENNRRYTGKENRAPLLIAICIYLMYLFVTLSVNVMLEIEIGVEGYKVWSIGLISLLSLPAGLLMSVSAIHTERTIHRENERTERRTRSEQRTNERTNEQRTANTFVRSRRLPNASSGTRLRILQYIEQVQSEQGRLPGPTEIASRLEVSKGYASDIIRSLPQPQPDHEETSWKS